MTFVYFTLGAVFGLAVAGILFSLKQDWEDSHK